MDIITLIFWYTSANAHKQANPNTWKSAQHILCHCSCRARANLVLWRAGNNNIELNLEVDSGRDRRDLKTWFEELWNDPELVEDVKQEVLLYLDQLYQNHPPEFIYYKTLFHIFEKFLDDTGKTDAELGQTSLFRPRYGKRSSSFRRMA